MTPDALMTIRLGILGALLVGATVLAALRREGWGWMLFIAFLLIPTIHN